jgi:hypothetical protein
MVYTGRVVYPFLFMTLTSPGQSRAFSYWLIGKHLSHSPSIVYIIIFVQVSMESGRFIEFQAFLWLAKWDSSGSESFFVFPVGPKSWHQFWMRLFSGQFNSTHTPCVAPGSCWAFISIGILALI